MTDSTFGLVWTKRARIIAGIGGAALVLFIGSAVFRSQTPRPEVVLAGMRTVEASGALLGSYGRRSEIVRRDYQFAGERPGDRHLYRRTSGPWPWRTVAPFRIMEYTMTRADSAYLERLGVELDSTTRATGKGGDHTGVNYRVKLEEISNLRLLVQELNDSLRASPDLAELIGDREYRIITAVAVIYDHNSVHLWNRDLNAGLQELGVQGFVSHRDGIKIHDGGIVGYRYARICWTAAGRVRELVTDEQGDDLIPCPDGSWPSLVPGNARRDPQR